MTKKWRVRMLTSMKHQYDIQAETYEEAISIVEQEIAVGETNPLTGDTILNESYTCELESIEEIKGEME